MARLIFKVYYSEYPRTDIRVSANIEIYDNYEYDEEEIETWRKTIAEMYDVSPKYVKTIEEIRKEERTLHLYPSNIEEDVRHSRLPGIDDSFIL